MVQYYTIRCVPGEEEEEAEKKPFLFISYKMFSIPNCNLLWQKLINEFELMCCTPDPRWK